MTIAGETRGKEKKKETLRAIGESTVGEFRTLLSKERIFGIYYIVL